MLRTLKRTRDMSVAEVKLVISIEDPRTRERRSRDMEVSVGVWGWGSLGEVGDSHCTGHVMLVWVSGWERKCPGWGGAAAKASSVLPCWS